MKYASAMSRASRLRSACSVAAVLAATFTCLEPAGAQVVLVNVALAKNADCLGFGRGTAMVDFDGDGRLDLFVLDDASPRVALRQLPDQTFENASAAWGIAPTATHDWAIVAADFDNDGDNDIFIGTGGFFLKEPNALLRNDLVTSGTFTDVSMQAGAISLVSAVFGATSLDYDADGLLDLYFCDANNDGTPGRGHLLHNDGGLTFSDVSASVGVDAEANYRHCSTGDIDNDGDLDIGAGGNTGDSRLWRNDAGISFTDIAPASGIQLILDPFGMVLEDFDLDGWMDIYVPLYQGGGTMGPSKLYRNLQGAGFQDVSVASGMTGQLDMGHNVFDLDNDGYFEIYIGTGSPETPYYDRLLSVFPSAVTGFTVQPLDASSGIGSVGPTRTHGLAGGDIDGDGDIDVYANTGGPSNKPYSSERNLLWENQGNDNGWIETSLRGVVSNRSAVGARVAAYLPSGRVPQQTLLAGRGFGTTDSPVLHVGLGTDTVVERLVVKWPSGIEQVLLAPAFFERHSIVETGLRLFGTPAPGSSFTLQLVGPGGDQAVLLLSTATAAIELPKYGGVLLVAPPFTAVFPLPLPGSGVLDLPVVLPSDPILSGITLYLQSWTHAPGVTAGGTLTNLVTLAIQ